MDYRTLGRSGCSVSSFCLGTMTFGVETDEQATTLRDLGCELAQGFLFSPAVSFEEIRARLM